MGWMLAVQREVRKFSSSPQSTEEYCILQNYTAVVDISGLFTESCLYNISHSKKKKKNSGLEESM